MPLDLNTAVGAGRDDDAGDSSTASAPPTPTGDSLDSKVDEEVIAPSSPPVAGDRDVQKEAILHARAYQLEMHEESLKRNIIVAMDTGSGKTQVAILRMQSELNKLSAGQLIWFLTPTVALCLQQHRVISTQIPGVLIKILSGSQQPETWSTPDVWNAFLENVSIVVSTPQVLSDALLHNFVKMSRLNLVVFDEAHNCVGNHPGSKVMDNYRRTKQAGLIVPAILGLTASPVMNASRNGLEQIEETMDAVCRTPTIHRSELLAQVNRPTVVYISYDPLTELEATAMTRTMASLQNARNGLDIRQDPYVQQMFLENTERSRMKLREAIQRQNTHTFQQMASLCRKSAELRKELGTWAADYFIHTVVTRYLDSVNKNDTLHGAWTLAERMFLRDTLKGVHLADPNDPMDTTMTHKVAKLIKQLVHSPKSTLGIIFVQETVTVAVLYRLLSLHPLTRDRFRVGTMVGLSTHAARRKDIGEINPGDGVLDLERFRSGDIDFLIATNVLEEGIDVPACNLVICFDQPSNVKAFIQRRGRARMKDSNLVLFCKSDQDVQSAWEHLEEEMKRKYEDEDRLREEIMALEDSTNGYTPSFSTPQGNVMGINDAKSHLEHFCAALFSKQFVEYRPYYLCKKTATTRAKSEPPLIRATVVLPNSLPPHLRRTESACAWYSEKKACKDAAFEAFKKLYDAGLVNEHFLPFKPEELVQSSDSRLAEIEVHETWTPWPRVAREWLGSARYRYCIRLHDNGQILCEFNLTLPVPMPKIPPFKVFWAEKPWTLEIGPTSKDVVVSDGDAKETLALLSLAYSYRHLEVKVGGQHVVHFHSRPDPALQQQKIDVGMQGSRPFPLDVNDIKHIPFLIRNTVNGAPYFFDRWLPSRPQDDLVQKKIQAYYLRELMKTSDFEGPWLSLKPWPKRRDFLHEVREPLAHGHPEKPIQTAWPASCCRIDSTPIINVQFGSLIPSITHVIEIYLVAQELADTVLKELCFHDTSLLVTAISASSARETTDYQRFEFLGDVLLKLLSTISVAVNHPHFPEGYLSKMRTRMVSNSRLCRSTTDGGIDKFILTKEFTGQKWQPFYVDELATIEEQVGKRCMSTKVLADIVESLTGAAFQDAGGGISGMDKALQCLRLLIPDNKWHNIGEGRHALLSLKEQRNDLPLSFTPVEGLLGYTFTNKTLLLESLTHASYNLGSSTDQSYERLEFIGDAILDYIIVFQLWGRNLPQSMMSPLRAACVNADLLGFLGMEWCTSRETKDVVNGQPISSTVHTRFWEFMRHSSAGLGTLQKVTKERHALERESLLEAIENSSTYPWALLAHLHVPKCFSDIFESVLGAVWLDSGDLEQCEAVVERIGITPYLRRMLDEGIDVIHPKNKLGEMAGQKTVKYEVGRETEASVHLNCKVYVGEELLVEIGEGLHKDEVITKAAERACEVLRRRKSDTAASDAMEIDG